MPLAQNNPAQKIFNANLMASTPLEFPSGRTTKNTARQSEINRHRFLSLFFTKQFLQSVMTEIPENSENDRLPLTSNPSNVKLGKSQNESSRITSSNDGAFAFLEFLSFRVAATSHGVTTGISRPIIIKHRTGQKRRARFPRRAR
jgi:hypothetical protein